jgi:hypothetical protein
MKMTVALNSYYLLVVFLTILACPPCQGAEEDAPFPPKEEPEKKAEVPAPAAVAHGPVLHKPWSDELRAFCASHKLEIKEQGDLQVKLLVIGGGQMEKGTEMLRLAKQTLDGYELWSGQQETFTRKIPIESETYHLVVFKNDADYVKLIDYYREKKLMPMPSGNVDLAKKLAGYPRPRMMFTKQSSVETVAENWAIYSTSCLAIDAFYASHNPQDPQKPQKRGPAWIREGMAAEMQRLQCKGSIRCTTIAYEENKEAGVDNWPNEVANMIKRNDPKQITATAAMRLSLDALPGSHYRQMWSLLSFVRQNCGTKKGPDNKFLRLLIATADGTSSENAVKTILGASDPSLTQRWHEWIPTVK